MTSCCWCSRRRHHATPEPEKTDHLYLWLKTQNKKKNVLANTIRFSTELLMCFGIRLQLFEIQLNFEYMYEKLLISLINFLRTFII